MVHAVHDNASEIERTVRLFCPVVAHTERKKERGKKNLSRMYKIAHNT